MSLRLLHHALPPPLLTIVHNSGLRSICAGVKPFEQIGPSRSYTLHAGAHRTLRLLRSLNDPSRTSTSEIPPTIRCSLSHRLLSSWAYGSTFTKAVTSRALSPWCTLPGTGPSVLARLRPCSTHSTSRSSTPLTPNMAPTEVDYRLPTNVKPTHYDLTVRTDITAAKFDGVVTVQYVRHLLPTALHL